MRLLYSKAKWEAGDISLDAFLSKCAAEGFHASDLYLPGQDETAAEIRQAHKDAGLKLIAHIVTTGATPEEHLQSLEKHFEHAIACEPILINSHTGKDYFTFADNLRLFQRSQELAAQAGITFCHETHRGRALYAATITRDFLREIPDLRLTADFSHWLCVHESDLSDQPETMALAIAATRHVHARVGFAEGPQIGDPRAEYFRGWVNVSLNFWKRIIRARKEAGAEFLTITPEFGPTPYMPVVPSTGIPVADAWTVNVWMKNFLQRELAGVAVES